MTGERSCCHKCVWGGGFPYIFVQETPVPFHIFLLISVHMFGIIIQAVVMDITLGYNKKTAKS